MTIVTENVKALEPEAHPGDTEQIWHGRLRALDDRSEKPKHRMASPRTEHTFRNWLTPDRPLFDVPLDQGPTPQCCGYGATHLLLAHRVVNHPTVSPTDLYNLAQRHDEWPGEGYAGTSVNGTMKALRELGLISAWTWSREVEEVARHIISIGPVALGTDWTADMDDTDGAGYVWPTGPVVGGHFYISIGVNMLRPNPDGTRGAFRCLNSWGEWGDMLAGRFWITFTAMQKLLDGIDPDWPGEAAAVIEI